MDKNALITSHLLATSRYIAVANVVIFCLSAYLGGGLFSIQVMLFALLLYWHVRIYFDQKLFVGLARQQFSNEDLDSALSILDLQKNSGNRPLVLRVQGAAKLWRYLVYTTQAQLLLFFIQS